MDRISLEILSLIASAVASSGPQIDLDKVYDIWGLQDKPKFPATGKPHDNSLAPYAAVSRDWQLAFEPFTFHTLVLSPKKIVQAERQGYLTRRRLRYIRNIAVPITFPLPWPWDVPIVFSQLGEWPPPSEVEHLEDQKLTEDDGSADENHDAREDVVEGDVGEDPDGYDYYFDEEDELQPPEERGYDKMFASIIKALFRILKLAPVYDNGQPYINLRLGFPVPREYGWCVTSRIEEPEAERTEAGWCTPLYFDLDLGEDELPELPVIASCRFDLVSWSLFITPQAACTMVSKMTHARKIKMHLSNMERKNPALRIKLREGFARSLSQIPHTVFDFECHYSRRIPRDHSYTAASIIPPNEKHDILSQALFNFSQRKNLIRFSAKGSFDLNIMGTSEKASGASSGWPKLETYEIGLLVITPSGQWLAIPFTDTPNTDCFRDERWGAPSEKPRSSLSTFEINEFRGPIDPDYAHRLLCAAGRAASHIPRLRRMDINVGVVGGYKVCYTSKRVNPCMRIVGKKLQPPADELLQVWRRVAQERDQPFCLEWKDTVKTNKRRELFS
ncbi:hypothetical protein FLAG1_08090 [Fusarium langsethiae]|uniref:DUF6546 domain-containing protein n=1 Tax=Fusarium langsethiae TaxID=179993 RepID=A0A0M9ET10_FUSLA|nr:hypothetical protein FLAG1_08090 [Fusarium langsethiae]